MHLPVVSVGLESLPSKGFGYPAGTTVSFNPFTLGELQTFNESTISKYERLKMLLDGISTTELQKGSLYYYDFLFISILRKASTFSQSTFDIRHVCAQCGNLIKTTANIGDFEFSDIEISDLPIVTTINDKEVEFVPLTVAKFLDAENKGVNKDRSEILARCIQNMSLKDAKELVEGLVGEDLEVVDAIEDMLDFGKQTMVVKCNNLLVDQEKCGHENKIPVNNMSDLILPFRRSTDTVQSRIRFGR